MFSKVISSKYNNANFIFFVLCTLNLIFRNFISVKEYDTRKNIKIRNDKIVIEYMQNNPKLFIVKNICKHYQIDEIFLKYRI